MQKSLFIGFSLASWLSEQGVSGSPNSLPDYLQSLVLEDHGIAYMLKDTPCSRSTDPRYNDVSGWSTRKAFGLLTLFWSSCYKVEIFNSNFALWI